MLSLTSLFRRVKKPAKNFGRILQFVNLGHADERTYEMVPSTGTAVGKAWSDGWKWRVVILVLLQVALGLTRDNNSIPNLGFDETKHITPTLRAISLRFAALEVFKFGCCAVLVYFETRRSRQNGQNRPGSISEAEPLRAEEGWQNEGSTASMPSYSDPKPLILGTTRSSVAIGFLALVLVANSYIVRHIRAECFALLTLKFVFQTEFILISDIRDASIIHLSTLLVPLLSAVSLRLFSVWSGSPQQWLGILLQILGLLSFENLASLPSISSISVIFLVALAFLTSLLCISAQHVYKLHDTIPNKINTRLFAYGLIFYTTLFFSSYLFFSDSTSVATGDSSIRTFFALVLRAAVDITSLNLIYKYGPVLFGVSTSASMTFLLLHTNLLGGSHSVNELCSLSVALLGFCAFWLGELYHLGIVDSACSTHSEKKTLPSWVLFPATLFFMLGMAAFVGSQLSLKPVEAGSLAMSTSPVQVTESVVFAGLPYIPPPPLPPPEPICTRVPLPSENFFTGNRTYREFDDVLLVVFFSHARYDANLDYYREVYSEFFPNMVFVGPKNREDKGFEHSYDVLVDSYESEEDISDWSNYKMAGRMAHHMLYTVLTTSPYSSNCYKGYLWAPFDTLLNIPRLQLFDQDRIWYFSPWAEYVPNPAIGEDAWRNASNHAPPARISPDPETDFEKYRGWWIDWWWGDPHYGIPVCRYAFEQVPLELRGRMAERFTKNETRYIGGSADTLYVPARLADRFVELLGTFLNTSCFLEIAVPTVVHLLVPENENILFVDHWWIWEPPFNASFVRDRWRKGMEVDTFHTFHWGDKDANGTWVANPGNIEDVRELFRESAVRQGVRWLT
ncbi:hypothetical protein ACEPAG_1595 [Sanghuangporus baumii]